MLVLAQYDGDRTVCQLPDGTTIELKVLSVHCGKVRLGWTAPKDFKIYRSEVLERMEAEAAAAAAEPEAA